MPEQVIQLPDPAKLLKKVLAEAQFQNTDIGGAVFSMLDSLSYDIVSNGWEWSDATDDLMQEVINILARDIDSLRTDDVETEPEETEETETKEVVDTETEDEDEEDIPSNEVEDANDSEDSVDGDIPVLEELETNEGQGSEVAQPQG